MGGHRGVSGEIRSVRRLLGPLDGGGLRVILRATIFVLTAVSGSVSIAFADKTDWRLGEQGEIAQACYDQGDWPCAFDGIMTRYEEAIADGLRCDQGRDDVQDGGQGCGLTVALLYDLAVKASVDVPPERRREVSERFLHFLTGYGVPDRKRFSEGVQLGANALRLDACIVLNDQDCATETSVTIKALADAQSPADLDGLIEMALTFDDYPLDLRGSIATARQLTEGTQP
jgi:hypothetical protein